MSEKLEKVANWRPRYDVTRKKIAGLRAKADLSKNPQYSVEIKETPRNITLTREMYSITFDKKRAMVTKADIVGTKLNEVRLPHLLIIDADGTELKQEDSTKGDLKVREEKFSIFLEGYFTLAGKKVPIVYEMDRMTGTTFCTMDVPGPLSVRRMTLEHSLGKTPEPLDTFYAPHHYLKKFKPYKPVVIKEYEIDIIFEKDTMMFWTNDTIGLQVFSISWDKSNVLDSEKKFRYGTGEIRNGESWIDLTFFSTGTKKAIDLPAGYRVTCAFSPMPLRKWRPKSEVFGSTYRMPTSESGIYKKGEAMEMAYNHFGRNGVTMVCHGAPHPTFIPVDPEETRWQAEMGRKNGVKTLLYIERSWANEEGHPANDMLTKEELLEGRQELACHFGPNDNGAARWGGGITMCPNYELWRTHLLTMIDYYVGVLGFDGVYLDTNFICSCTNTRHGESPDESTSVRGSMTFQQDLRLLIDDYIERNKREYQIINHYWEQHSAPVSSLGDYVLPGEQDAGKHMASLNPAQKTFSYSVIPTGVNSIWYSADTYDYSSPQIYKDAADCGGLIWLSPYVEGLAEYPPMGRLLHMRHAQPLTQWNLRGSQPVHRYSKEYAKIFTGGDKHTRAIIYIKANSRLVHLVNDGPKAKSTSFSVAVPKEWKKCLVLNAARMRWRPVDVKRGRVEMTGQDCTEGPQPIIIKPFPKAMGYNWHDNICRSIDMKVNGNKGTVRATGVAGAIGACFIEVPDGIGVASGGRDLGSMGPNIYIMPLPFTAEGVAEMSFETCPVVKAPRGWSWLMKD